MSVEIGSPGVIFPPFDNVIEQAKRNEEKGYDAIWWPDHLMGWFPQALWTPDLVEAATFLPSPHIFLETTTTMAAVALSTNRIKIGTCVTEMIRRPPAVLAQTFLTLDHIAKGRVVLGIGAGEAENIVPYGLDYSHAVSRLEEALEIVRLFWESGGEKINYDGKFWKLRSAVLSLPPYDGTFPKIWVGAHGPRMLEITGRFGDGWIPTYLSPTEYSEGLETIYDSAKRANKNVSEFVPAMWTWLIIDEESSECYEMLDSLVAKATGLIIPSIVYESLGFDHPFGKKNWHGLRDYIPENFTREEILRALDKVPRKVVEKTILWGSVDEVIAKIEGLRKVGLRHIVLQNMTFLCDFKKLQASFRSMDKVLQHFKQDTG